MLNISKKQFVIPCHPSEEAEIMDNVNTTRIHLKPGVVMMICCVSIAIIVRGIKIYANLPSHSDSYNWNKGCDLSLRRINIWLDLPRNFSSDLYPDNV